MSRLPRVAGLTGVVLTAAALFSFTGTAAQADPGICIDHVMENGYEATANVLKACKIAKTGKEDDARTCRRMLRNEGVRREVASHACRIASYPEQSS
jgi:pimeloyl-CoA synthetase